MARDIACPTCGETEELRGEPTADGVSLTCQECGARWMRDTTEPCATCGGRDLVTRPRALTQYSRGTQLSIVGWQDVPLCVTCDTAALRRSTDAGGPIRSDYRPAAQHPPQN